MNVRKDCTSTTDSHSTVDIDPTSQSQQLSLTTLYSSIPRYVVFVIPGSKISGGDESDSRSIFVTQLEADKPTSGRITGELGHRARRAQSGHTICCTVPITHIYSLRIKLVEHCIVEFGRHKNDGRIDESFDWTLSAMHKTGDAF
jgi:hypothetical protein